MPAPKASWFVNRRRLFGSSNLRGWRPPLSDHRSRPIPGVLGGRHSSFRKSGTVVQLRPAPGEREGDVPIPPIHRYTVEHRRAGDERRRSIAEQSLEAAFVGGFGGAPPAIAPSRLEDYTRPPGPTQGPLGFVGALRLDAPPPRPAVYYESEDMSRSRRLPLSAREIRQARAPRRVVHRSLETMLAEASVAPRPDTDTATIRAELDEDRRAFRDLYGRLPMPDAVE